MFCKWVKFDWFTNLWTGEYRIVAPNITLLSFSHTRFLFGFSIKLLFRLGLASRFCQMWLEWYLLWAWHYMSYLTDRAKRHWNNKHTFFKVFFPQSLLWLPLHSVHVSQPITQTILVWGKRTHTASTAVSICTIISGRIHHFTRLTMTILNS